MDKYKPPYYSITLLLVLILAINPGHSQVLPQPSGKYNIGHHRCEWTDSSRKEIFGNLQSFRRVVADIWYPAEKSGGQPSSYLDTITFKRALGDSGFRSFLDTRGVEFMRSGKLQTHAREDAAFDHKLQRAPVILFSHGMGMLTQLYTVQIEDLASHGYIVVALSHPYDAWLVSFKDGADIVFESSQRNAAGNTEEQHIAYENTRVEWWAADIQFALNQLTDIQTGHSIAIAGHLDLSKVAAMGHSVGGRAAARACQLDARIKACADQDGVARMQPFYLDQHSMGMKQPFLLFERVSSYQAGEADAKSMGMTLAEMTALINQLRAGKRAALAATGGSFHVLLHFDSSSHMSFSDWNLLQASTAEETRLAIRILQVTCAYTRQFFDKTLLHLNAPLYDGNRKLQFIDLVEKIPPAVRRR